MTRLWIVATAVLGSLFFVSAAMAATPPVVDQYTEQKPTPGGETPAAKPGESPTVPGDRDSSGDPANSGQVGVDAGDPVQTAPAENPEGGNGAAPSSDSGGNSPSEGSGQAVAESDDEGMGIVFPLILVAIVAIAFVLLIRRRRTTQAPQ